MRRSRKHKANSSITQDELKEWLRYDPVTGVFTRLKGGRWNRDAGTQAGTRSKNWYVKIYLLGTFYHAHRLAWFYMTGNWPEGEIDHINREKSDNRWANLREATASQNLLNKLAQTNSGTGIRGVHYYKSRNQWVPYINENGKLRRLGYYATLEEAQRVREEAAMRLHGAFFAREK